MKGASGEQRKDPYENSRIAMVLALFEVECARGLKEKEHKPEEPVFSWERDRLVDFFYNHQESNGQEKSRSREDLVQELIGIKKMFRLDPEYSYQRAKVNPQIARAVRELYPDHQAREELTPIVEKFYDQFHPRH